MNSPSGRSYQYQRPGNQPTRTRSKKERIRLLFLLLKQVVVPAQPYTEQTDADKRTFTGIIKDGLSGLLGQ